MKIGSWLAASSAFGKFQAVITVTSLLASLLISACGGGSGEVADSPAFASASSEARFKAQAISTSRGWWKVATEGETFVINGTLPIRYGNAPNWVVKSMSGSVSCANWVFGSDPAVGVSKSCEADAASGSGTVEGASGNWQSITTEGSSFVLNSVQKIHYGSGTHWIEKNSSGDVRCTNEFFGNDPAPGIVKTCEFLPTGTSSPVSGTPGVWANVARENQSFSVTGQMLARYGAEGKWVEKVVGGQVYCSNAAFGDPISGVGKTCEVLQGSSVSVAAVTLKWISPAALSTVSGVAQLQLAGTAFKNVEFFKDGTMIARASVTNDGTSATASIDTKTLPDGQLTLTGHAWNSPAGTSFTSEADAGALTLVVANTVVPSPPMVGVYVGNTPADVARFETWFGNRVDGVLGYTGNASWSDFDGSVGWATGLWAPIDRKIFWSVPLIVNGSSLTDAAAGAFDSHYTLAAEKLVKFRPQDGKVHIRTGWEFNGSWFPWSAAGQPDKFITAYRRFVNAFRAVAVANGTPDRFVFEWNISIGDNGMNPELAYPGDAYVDIIGLDVYWFGKPRFNSTTQRWEQWDPADPIAAWNKQLTRSYGLNWHKAFASQHGKKMSYSEWGVETDTAGPYIDRMAAWMKSNNSIFHTYWDSNSAYPGMLSTGANPTAGAAYRSAFR